MLTWKELAEIIEQQTNSNDQALVKVGASVEPVTLRVEFIRDASGKIEKLVYISEN